MNLEFPIQSDAVYNQNELLLDETAIEESLVSYFKWTIWFGIDWRDVALSILLCFPSKLKAFHCIS